MIIILVSIAATLPTLWVCPVTEFANVYPATEKLADRIVMFVIKYSEVNFPRLDKKNEEIFKVRSVSLVTEP